MPELPEVETTLRGIYPHIHNQRITDVVVRERQLRWPIPHNLKQKLLKQTVIQLTRRGKYLLASVDTGTVIIHLGMSGSLRAITQPMPVQKHEHVDIVFSNNIILRYKDPRRFGAILWTMTDPNQHPLIKTLGIEPLKNHFSGRYLWQAAQGRRVPIKTFIMDNKIVTGIGNIYATETLFLAGIHPMLPANLVTLERLQELVRVIKRILHQAIKLGGTTLKDFVDSNGKPGYFANKLNVYGRAGLPCVQCRLPLRAMRICQRTTTYCESCQQ
jgi:formamidopyrimidine-DNA glycosylase